MFKLNSEYVSRVLSGIGCLAAALWLVIHTYNWIHATWFSDTDITLPIMASLMAAMLVATGVSAIFRVNEEELEPYYSENQFPNETVYER